MLNKDIGNHWNSISNNTIDNINEKKIYLIQHEMDIFHDSFNSLNFSPFPFFLLHFCH